MWADFTRSFEKKQLSLGMDADEEFHRIQITVNGTLIFIIIVFSLVPFYICNMFTIYIVRGCIRN